MEKCTSEELFSEQTHVACEKEYEAQTAVVMYPLQAGITKTGVNSFEVAERNKAACWRRKDLLIGFPLACTRLILPFHIPPQWSAERQSGGISSPCPQSNLIPQARWMALVRQQGKPKKEKKKKGSFQLSKTVYLQQMTVTLKIHDK